MNMLRRALIVTSALLLASGIGIGIASCADDDFYENDELGVEIEDFDWATAKRSTQDDGDALYEEDGHVYIDGMGDRWVDVDDEQPDTPGGKQVLTVIDREDGNKRIYSFDPATNSLSFSDGTTTLEVVQNPDKTYTVDGVLAANGKEAVALLKESPVYRDASAWGFIMTYSVCQSCLARSGTRTPTCCENCGSLQAASEPAVCDIFKDLCDCAACDKAGKTSCSLCP
jgi:hypothetical protein